MSQLALTTAGETRSKWALPRLHPGLWLSYCFLGTLIAASVLASFVAPHSPTDQNLTNTFAGPSAQHLLGTAGFGRDVLRRLIWGGRSAFFGVAIAVAVSLLLGIPWGLIAGYWPRWIGASLLRVADALLAFPGLVLAVAITGVLGPSLITSMSALGVVYAPTIARILAAGVSETRNRDFVLSARLSGCPPHVVLLRHLLPHAIGPVVVQVTVLTGLTFLAQAALSFLGLGIQPPTPSWGGDLSDAYLHILSAPQQILPSGILISLVVLAVYRVGDAVRDRMYVRGR